MDVAENRVSKIAGSIVAVPIFLVVYLAAATAVYIIFVFFNSVSNAEGPTRWVELMAAGLSGYLGALAGQGICKITLKAWNGWPAFIVTGGLLIAGGIAGYIIGRGWWELVLLAIQATTTLAATWTYMVRQDPPAGI